MFPPSDGFQSRWLRPSIGGVALSSMVSWWTLLFGLSMLARYEPAVWVSHPGFHGDFDLVSVELRAAHSAGIVSARSSATVRSSDASG